MPKSHDEYPDWIRMAADEIHAKTPGPSLSYVALDEIIQRHFDKMWRSIPTESQLWQPMVLPSVTYLPSNTIGLPPEKVIESVELKINYRKDQL